MSTAAPRIESWRGRYLGTTSVSDSGSSFGAPEYPVVELWLGETLGWVDITGRVRYEGESSIAITRGRSSEGATSDPSTCRMRLDNADGALSARLPTGPYYGLLKRNTPIRVSVIRNGVKRFRFYGEVASWPVESDISGNDVTVDISAGGVLRRLQQGQSSLDSALWRYIKASSPSEAWPLTDGVITRDGAESLNLGTVLRETITTGNDHIGWGTGTLAEWIEHTANIPVGGNGYLRGKPAYDSAAASGWTVAFCRVGEGDVDSLTFFDAGAQTDTSPRISFKFNFDRDLNTFTLSATSNSGSSSSTTNLFNLPSSGLFDGELHTFRATFTPSGANTLWTLSIDGDNTSSGVSAVGAVRPVGSVSLDWFNAAATGSNPTYGFITYWASPAAGTDYNYAATGFRGETAVERLSRLCQEESIQFARVAAPGAPDESTAMGPQAMEGLIALLRSCENSDQGLLYEPVDFLGVAYRDRVSLFDQAAQLELVYHSEHQLGAGLSPVDDDRNTLNHVQVSQEFGSIRVITDETSSMSVLPPPAGVGRYDSSAQASLAEAYQIGDHGGWLVHLGTVDEARYPQIRLDLRHSTFTGSVEMMAQALTLDMGSRILVTDPPSWWPPDDISQLAIGFVENLGVREHEIWVNCTPESPYHVARLQDAASNQVNPLSRIDTAGSELLLPVSETDTTLAVKTTRGARWFYTDNPALPNAEHPWDIRVGGEVMTVNDTTSVAGDIFARTVSPGWGTANSGQTWTTSGGAASDFSVSFSSAHIAISALATGFSSLIPVVASDIEVQVNFALDQVPTGDLIDVQLLARAEDSTNNYNTRIRISAGGSMALTIRRRQTASDTQLATFALGTTYAANAVYTIKMKLEGSTISAKCWLASGREPDYQASATDSFFAAPGSVGVRTVTGAALTNVLPVNLEVDSLNSLPQLFFVTRSVNGVVKAQVAGEDVRLAYPAYLSH